MNKKDISDCQHSQVVIDTNLINALTYLIQLNEKVDSKKYNEYVDKMDIKTLDTYVEECPQLRLIN